MVTVLPEPSSAVHCTLLAFLPAVLDLLRRALVKLCTFRAALLLIPIYAYVMNYPFSVATNERLKSTAAKP